MNIEISNEATKRIQDAIGKSDPETINLIFERLSLDKELLIGLTAEEIPLADIDAIKEGVADYNKGRVQAFEDVDAELRNEFGFDSRSS